MKTTLVKTENGNKQWHLIDAADRTVGKIAVAAATILRGKHLPSYTPHLDSGEFVVVINADKAVLTGNKLAEKAYHTHSGYLGHLKTKLAKDLPMATVIEKAVFGMLPKTRTFKKLKLRLHVFGADAHDHTAQQPQPLTF